MSYIPHPMSYIPNYIPTDFNEWLCMVVNIVKSLENLGVGEEEVNAAIHMRFEQFKIINKNNPKMLLLMSKWLDE